MEVVRQEHGTPLSNEKSALALALSDIAMEAMQDGPAALFKVPACSFKPTLHAEYEAIKAECEPWTFALVSPKSPQAAQYWCDCLIPLLSSMMHVQCPADRVASIAKVLTWFFMADDADDDPSSCEEHFQKHQDLVLACLDEDEVGATNGQLLTGRYAFLHDLWKGMAIGMPPSMRSRYREKMAEYLNATRLQAPYRRNCDLQLSVNDYVFIRRQAAGMFPFYVLLEYGLGIELDAHTLGSTLLAQIHDAVTDQLALYNDIVSSIVEIQRGDYFNLPAIIFREHVSVNPQFSFLEAMQEAVAMVDNLDKLCVQLMDKARQSTMIKKPGVQAYIQGLEFFLAAFADWSLKTARYNRVLLN